MNKKITVIGSLNYDVILKIPRLPFKGETLTATEQHLVPAEKVLIRQFRQQN